MTAAENLDDLTEKIVMHDLVPRRLTVLRTVDLTPRTVTLPTSRAAEWWS